MVLKRHRLEIFLSVRAELAKKVMRAPFPEQWTFSLSCFVLLPDLYSLVELWAQATCEMVIGRSMMRAAKCRHQRNASTRTMLD